MSTSPPMSSAPSNFQNVMRYKHLEGIGVFDFLGVDFQQTQQPDSSTAGLRLNDSLSNDLNQDLNPDSTYSTQDQQSQNQQSQSDSPGHNSMSIHPSLAALSSTVLASEEILEQNRKSFLAFQERIAIIKLKEGGNSSHNKSQSDQGPGQGQIASFLTLVKGFVGIGVLSLPYAFACGGYVAGPLGLLALSFIAYRCMLKLLSACDEINRRLEQAAQQGMEENQGHGKSSSELELARQNQGYSSQSNSNRNQNFNDFDDTYDIDSDQNDNSNTQNEIELTNDDILDVEYIFGNPSPSNLTNKSKFSNQFRKSNFKNFEVSNTVNSNLNTVTVVGKPMNQNQAKDMDIQIESGSTGVTAQNQDIDEDNQELTNQTQYQGQQSQSSSTNSMTNKQIQNQQQSQQMLQSKTSHRNPMIMKPQYSKVTTFGDVGRFILGPFGKSLVNLSILLTQAGFGIAYLIFIPENTQKVLCYETNQNVCPKTSTLLFFTCIFLLPFVWLRDIKQLVIPTLLANVTLMMGIGWGFLNAWNLVDAKVNSRTGDELVIGEAHLPQDDRNLMIGEAHLPQDDRILLQTKTWQYQSRQLQVQEQQFMVGSQSVQQSFSIIPFVTGLGKIIDWTTQTLSQSLTDSESEANQVRYLQESQSNSTSTATTIQEDQNQETQTTINTTPTQSQQTQSQEQGTPTVVQTQTTIAPTNQIIPTTDTVTVTESPGATATVAPSLQTQDIQTQPTISPVTATIAPTVVNAPQSPDPQLQNPKQNQVQQQVPVLPQASVPNQQGQQGSTSTQQTSQQQPEQQPMPQINSNNNLNQQQQQPNQQQPLPTSQSVPQLPQGPQVQPNQQVPQQIQPIQTLPSAQQPQPAPVTVTQTVQQPKPKPEPKPSFMAINFNQYPIFFGIAVFTFEGIGLLLPVRRAMSQPEKMPQIVTSAMIFLTVLFISFGLSCYIHWGGPPIEEKLEKLRRRFLNSSQQQVTDGPSITQRDKNDTVEEDAVIGLSAMVTFNYPQSRATSFIILFYVLGIFFSYPVMMFPVFILLEGSTFIRTHLCFPNRGLIQRLGDFLVDECWRKVVKGKILNGIRSKVIEIMNLEDKFRQSNSQQGSDSTMSGASSSPKKKNRPNLSVNAIGKKSKLKSQKYARFNDDNADLNINDDDFVIEDDDESELGPTNKSEGPSNTDSASKPSKSELSGTDKHPRTRPRPEESPNSPSSNSIDTVPKSLTLYEKCLLRAIITFLSALSAISIPNFGLFLSLLGAVTCNLLAFIFPAYFHYKLLPNTTPKEDVFYIVFGVLAGMWSFGSTLAEFFGSEVEGGN